MKNVKYILIITLLIVSAQASENVDFLKEDGTIDVSEIIAYLQRTGANWYAEENAFTRMTESERQSYLGYDFEEVDTTRMKLFGNIRIKRLGSRKSVTTTPDHWDWRDVTGSDWTTDVRGQGSCGSCWAFATLAPIEAAINITANDPGRDEDLSEEMLVHDCYPTYNCGGGNYSGSYGYLLSNAICLEDCYPYTATNGACDPCINWEEESYQLDSLEVYSGSGHTAYERKEAIKEMLMDGPVSVAFTVLSDFYSYSGGVYNSTATPPYPNHGVAIIGYDERGPEPYWICKNSWGSGWGDSGYFNIHMGILHIDDYAYRPIFNDNISLAKTNNIEPIDNGYISSLTPNLKWTIEADLASAHFELQIDEDIHFSSPITISSSSSTIGFSPSLPTAFSSGEISYLIGSQGESLVNGETYWWRVRASRSGNHSHWSKSTSFTINTSISYDGWFQTTSEQFTRDIRSDYSLKISEDKVEKLYSGVLFETDFEYSNLTEFHTDWNTSAGEDSAGYSSDSLIRVLWYENTDWDTTYTHSNDHSLLIADSSITDCGYAYAEIDTVKAGRIDIWFYFEDPTTNINIIGIHNGDILNDYYTCGRLSIDSIYWAPDDIYQYRFIYYFHYGSLNYYLFGDPSCYLSEWHKYTLLFNSEEPFIPHLGDTFPGTARIYIDDALVKTAGLSDNFVSSISFGTNILNNNKTGYGYYDDLSISGLGDSVAYFYSPSIILDTTLYWNRLFWTQDMGVDIDIELQYRSSGSWITYNTYNTAGSSGDVNISGIGDVDTIRLIGVFTNVSDSSICMYDWGVNWSSTPDTTDTTITNRPPEFVSCPDTINMFAGTYRFITGSSIDPDTDRVAGTTIIYPMPYRDWWFDSIDAGIGWCSFWVQLTPSLEDTGLFNFAVQVCDTYGLCDTCSFTVHVMPDTTTPPINNPPEISDCPTDTVDIVAGGMRYLVFHVSDLDTDSLAMELYEYPSGSVWWFDSLAGIPGYYTPWIYVNPFLWNSGLYNFAFKICDGEFCDTCEFVINVIDTTTPLVEIIVNPGWNLLSVPSSSPQPWTIYGNIPYGYDPSIADYVVSDSLHSGKGYFVLSTAPDTVEIPPGLFSFTDTVQPGWNLLGGLDHASPSNRFITIPPDLSLSPFYGWNGSDYFYTDSLYPGHGYWFLSSGHGRIIVGP